MESLAVPSVVVSKLTGQVRGVLVGEGAQSLWAVISVSAIGNDELQLSHTPKQARIFEFLNLSSRYPSQTQSFILTAYYQLTLYDRSKDYEFRTNTRDISQHFKPKLTQLKSLVRFHKPNIPIYIRQHESNEGIKANEAK